MNTKNCTIARFQPGTKIGYIRHFLPLLQRLGHGGLIWGTDLYVTSHPNSQAPDNGLLPESHKDDIYEADTGHRLTGIVRTEVETLDGVIRLRSNLLDEEPALTVRSLRQAVRHKPWEPQPFSFVGIPMTAPTTQPTLLVTHRLSEPLPPPKPDPSSALSAQKPPAVFDAAKKPEKRVKPKKPEPPPLRALSREDRVKAVVERKALYIGDSLGFAQKVGKVLEPWGWSLKIERACPDKNPWFPVVIAEHNKCTQILLAQWAFEGRIVYVSFPFVPRGKEKQIVDLMKLAYKLGCLPLFMDSPELLDFNLDLLQRS